MSGRPGTTCLSDNIEYAVTTRIQRNARTLRDLPYHGNGVGYVLAYCDQDLGLNSLA